MKFYFLTFELQKYEKYQITFEITDLKTEKKKQCWSRFIVIWDFFIEIEYYTIQNIWKQIDKLNFVIIDVDVARKGIVEDHDIIQHMDYLIYYVFCI